MEAVTIPNLKNEPILILDTETTGLQWWAGHRPIGIGVGVPGGASWYLPFGHSSGNTLSEDDARAWAKDNLQGKTLIGHNVKFDVHMLREWGVDLESLGCTLQDTMHMAALLHDSRRSFSLDALSRDLLGSDGKVRTIPSLLPGKGEPIDPSRMASYRAEEITPYAIQDLKLTGQLWSTFQVEIYEQNLEYVQHLEQQVIFPVCEMERNPPRLDMEKLRRWGGESEVDFKKLLLSIKHETGVDFNPNASQSWEKLFHSRGLQSRVQTDGGKKGIKKESYASHVIESFKDDPIVSLAHQARKLSSLRSKYILAYLKNSDSDGRLRTQFHQLRTDSGGTVSGRFSSSSYQDPATGEQVGANLQQVFAVKNQIERFGPKYIVRELFLPDQGSWFSADAAQIEYRIFAHYANSERILSQYRENPDSDFHQIMLDLIFPHVQVSRKHLKNVNFARIYGAGLDKIAEMLGINLLETKKILDIYDREIPEGYNLLRQAGRVAKTRGRVKTILGRRARFPRGERIHKALNSIIQGTAADIMKKKIVEVYRERKRLGIQLRLTVHDELGGDIDGGAAELKKILDTQTTELRVPILWGVKLGKNWAECH